MKNIIRAISLLFVAGLLHTVSLYGQTTDVDVFQTDDVNRVQVCPNEYIIKCSNSSPVKFVKKARGVQVLNSTSMSTIFDSLEVISTEPLPLPVVASRSTSSSSLYLLKIDASRFSTWEVTEMLTELDEVEYAEPNYVVHAMVLNDDDRLEDPMFPDQWGLEAINMPALWSVTPVNDKRPVIAILDTGVDITHPDLVDNIWTNSTEQYGFNNYDDDQNGYRDDFHGWDFVNNSPSIHDENGHGTHCAGIAGAVSYNGIGIMGANPDALIMPVTVLGRDGAGSTATLIKGLQYASSNGADIISMSLGSYGNSQSLQEALQLASSRSILVAAAGNDNLCLYDEHKKVHGDKTKDHLPCFPAAYSFVIGVQATNQFGQMASFTNFDCDGPTSSAFSEEEQFNYELSAPGQEILSTYPGGRYKKLSGTSMACPLVAGAISRLLQLKSYTTTEEMLSDLIHTSSSSGIDVEAAFNNDASKRTPKLEIIAKQLDDNVDGDGDGNFDAGEIIDLYTTVKNVCGYAKNVTISLSVAENEDPDIIEVLDNDIVETVSLSPYAFVKATKPIRFKISDECADDRKINLKVTAKAENSINVGQLEFTISIDNGLDFHGFIEDDLTLVKNTTYNVTGYVAVPEGVTLTIPEGCKLKFKKNYGMEVLGTLNILGTVDNHVVITGGDQNAIGSKHGIFKYLETNMLIGNIRQSDIILEDCLFSNVHHRDRGYAFEYFSIDRMDRCCFYNSPGSFDLKFKGNHTNIVNNIYSINYVMSGNKYEETTVSMNFAIFNCGDDLDNPINLKTGGAIGDVHFQPTYWGTANEKILKRQIADGLVEADLSKKLDRPSAEAHGLVWKILVNGKDAQDEYEEMTPLGLGRHKFEIYFNRPMDKNFPPEVSMGVRQPYTQVSISEGGSWNEDGTIYSVFLSLDGNEQIDGVNRIYVDGAQDLEHFPIPFERTRFNVNVNLAGALETGLMATPGLGKIDLEWETKQSDFPDMQGYNIYRYTQRKEIYTEWGKRDDGTYGFMEKTRIVNDSIIINKSMLDIDVTSYTDYDVIPGTTYFYCIREMYTDLKQLAISNTVVATAKTSELGDSNGSGNVDVADVVTDIAYITDEHPKPFIFEAADVNKDKQIDIIDIVKTINLIYGNISVSSQTCFSDDIVAIAWIENNCLFIDSPVEVGGIEVLANSSAQLEPLVKTPGFEHVTHRTSEDAIVYLSYSMSGSAIPAGKQALLRIEEDCEVNNMILTDTQGNKIPVLLKGIDTTLSNEIDNATVLEAVVYDIEGKEKLRYKTTADMGQTIKHHKNLSSGVYLLVLYSKEVPVGSSKFFIN